ncbi:MAG: hypothetical protein WA112_01575 [Rugosibacter sp.]|jgi:hypothetical protein
MNLIDTPDTLAQILAYHERTKHRPERYAAGPEALDWDAQPSPFREFAGAGLDPRPDKTAAFQFQPWLAVNIP